MKKIKVISTERVLMCPGLDTLSSGEEGPSGGVAI
jgi:hypothetical protein